MSRNVDGEECKGIFAVIPKIEMSRFGMSLVLAVEVIASGIGTAS